MCAQGLRNSNQILHGEQTVLEEHFYGVDHTTCHGRKSFDMDVDARSFVVASLVDAYK